MNLTPSNDSISESGVMTSRPHGGASTQEENDWLRSALRLAGTFPQGSGNFFEDVARDRAL